MDVAAEADVVVVGAGSAGCVLAARLSEDGRRRVVLLEAGGDDRPLREPRQFLSNLMIHVPLGYASTLSDPRVAWLYKTEPDADGRVHTWPRGRVLGGSSSINAMLYVRGQARDYDGWRQGGATGWSWEDVRPFFLRAERQQREALRADPDLHGADGPLSVADMDGHPVSERAIEAGMQAGLPRLSDLNGAAEEGIGWFQVTQRRGLRCSAATAYLHPAMGRPNLAVTTRALAIRIVFEGRRAVGVAFRQHGRERLVRARAEVILSGGAVNSPQLLQLSGIGPGAVLRDAGIPVLVDSPEVGENLQDHYVAGCRYRLTPGTVSVNESARGLRLVGEIARYLRHRRGLLAMSAAHLGAFVRSRPDLEGPDIQFHILPASMDLAKLRDHQRMELEREPGLTLAPCQLRPESRGHVRVRSADPEAAPAIVPNYLADPLDREVIVAGLRWARRIVAQPALRDLVAAELDPGPACASEADLLAYAVATGSTIYHPVGTCRMGSDPGAVVDPALRVNGVEGLRVVDASVMPRITSGNTNAPTIMIAEKASAMIGARGATAA